MNHHGFQTTHWSVVLTAKGNGTSAEAALRVLCDAYYEPVRHFIERIVNGDSSRIYGGRDVNDLTHDFMAKLLEGEMFQRLEWRGSSFRSYLLGAVRHFLSKTRQKEATLKRGGDFVRTSLPADSPEWYVTDDAVFDRDWAQTMLDRAIASLRVSPESEVLIPWINREVDAKIRSQLAAELGMTDIAVKVALHRLRGRFREEIRARVAETVEYESEIDGELDHLIRALRGGKRLTQANDTTQTEVSANR